MNRMTPMGRVVVLAVSSLLYAGCGGVVPCNPGQRGACTCPGGGASSQVCQDDGTFGACACEGGATGGGVGTTGGGIGTSGGGVGSSGGGVGTTGGGDGTTGGGVGTTGGGMGTSGGGVGASGGGVATTGGGVGATGGGVGTTGGGVGSTGGGSSTTGGGTGTSDGGTTDGGFVLPPPFAIPLSQLGADALLSVTAGPNGSFYAAGYASATVGAPRDVVAVKILADASLDTTFGSNGIATLPMIFAGGDDEIDIATQPDGKLVVTATVANGLLFTDRDIGVVRLNANGTVDTTFGTSGKRVIDLSTGILLSTAQDAPRSLTIDASGRISIHAVSRADGLLSGLLTPRTDSDFTIVRLTPDGALDSTFANNGMLDLDILVNAQHTDATPRHMITLGDGSLLAVGYSPGLDGEQPVVIKVTAAGLLDVTFGANGLFTQPVMSEETQAVSVVAQGTNLVVVGTGSSQTLEDAVVAARLDQLGNPDMSWGDDGVVVIDGNGALTNNIVRAAVGLPNNKVLVVGSSGAPNTTFQNGALIVLDSIGGPDNAYAGGIHIVPFGSDGIDIFNGAAVSGNQVLVVGASGVGVQLATSNDNSFGLFLPLR